jgi:hypothetical protein
MVGSLSGPGGGEGIEMRNHLLAIRHLIEVSCPADDLPMTWSGPMNDYLARKGSKEQATETSE